MINNFKEIFTIVIFHFGEINNSLFWVFSKLFTLIILVFVSYYISEYIKKNEKKMLCLKKTQNNETLKGEWHETKSTE